MQNSNNNIELYIINSWNAWYVNYVSISLFFFFKFKHWDITNKTVIFTQVLTDKLPSLLSGKVHGKLNCNQMSAW